MMRFPSFSAAARFAGVAFALLFVFLASFVAGVALHLPLPPSRRLATAALSTGISRSIRGTVEVDSIDRLSFSGFEASGVVIRDPLGNKVLAAPRLRARAGMVGFIISSLGSSGPVVLRFSWIRAERIDVTLIEDADGAPTLAKTFLPPAKLPTAPPAFPVAPPRPVVVDLPAIEIGAVAVRGSVRSLGEFDADAQSLTGSVYVGPGEARIDTRAFPLVVRRIVPGTLSTTLDFHWQSPGLFWGDFLASYGDVLFSGKAKLDGTYLDAYLDVPHTSSDALLLASPGLRPGLAWDAHGEVHGAFPQLDTSLRVQLAQTTLEARGRTVVVGPGADFDVTLRRLDLSLFRAGLPETDLGLDAHVVAEIPKGKPFRGRISGVTLPTVIAQVEVPNTEFACDVDPEGIRGTVQLHESGMPIDATVRVSKTGDVEVTARTAVVSLMEPPRLRHVIEGRAKAQLEATWVGGRVDARLTAEVTGVKRGPVALESGKLSVQLAGEPSALEVDAVLHGVALDVGGLRWSTPFAALRGPLGTPHMMVQLKDKALPDILAQATLDFRKEALARDVVVTIEEAGLEVSVAAAGIRMRDGEVDVGEFVIKGIGEPIQGTARVGADSFQLRAAAPRVDLGRLADAMTFTRFRVGGQAALAIDLRNAGSVTDGCVALDAPDFKFDPVSPLTIPSLGTSLRADFAGSGVTVESNVWVGGVLSAVQGSPFQGTCLPVRSWNTDALAHARFAGKVELAGSPLRSSSWVGATGNAELTELAVNLNHNILQVGLSAVRTAMPSAKVPFLEGHLQATRIGVVRTSAEEFPSWDLTGLSSSDLKIDLGSEQNPQKMEGANVFASAGMTSDGQATVNVCLRDDNAGTDVEPCKQGDSHVIVALNGEAKVDVGAAMRGDVPWRTALAVAAIDARVNVAQRDFASLIKPFPWTRDAPIVAKAVDGWVHLTGSVAAPKVDLVARVRDGALSNPLWKAEGTYCLTGSYHGTKATLTTAVFRQGSAVPATVSLESLCNDDAWRTAQRGSPAAFDAVGTITVKGAMDWEQALRVTSLDDLPWTADIGGNLAGVNLAWIPWFKSRGIGGKLSGLGTITDLQLGPKLHLGAAIDNLSIGRAGIYGPATLELDTVNGLEATLSVGDWQLISALGFDEEGMKGTLDVKKAGAAKGQAAPLHAAFETRQIVWGDTLFPQLSTEDPVNLEVHANRFDVGTLAPFVSPALSYIGGQLDGDFKASWSPKAGMSSLREVNLTLSNGACEVPLLGQEFTGIVAHMSKSGPNRLQLDGVRALAAVGRLDALAVIELVDLVPSHVAASVWTDARNRIRLTYEGIPMGDFEGVVYADVDFRKDANEANIAFANAKIALSEAEVRNVQDTAANPEIHMVSGPGGIRFAGTAGGVEDATGKSGASEKPWKVRLTTRTPIAVSRSDLNLTIASPKDADQAPLLTYPDERGRASMQGYLELGEGRLQVVGKGFELEREQGRLTFDPNADPGSPLLNVTARWDAPDGTRVLAEVVGPLKAPRVKFRSVPAKPAADILAMILTGVSPSGAEPSGVQGEEARAAAGVGGGVAAAGINSILQDISPISVSTRVDASQAQNIRPSVAVAVLPTVTAETTLNTGASALGQAQDVAQLTLDWRFLRDWSMRTTVGETGTSVFDVVWQHRY